MGFLDNVKAVPITEYAERLGYTVVRKGGRYASLKEHDSVMIDLQKNCYWRNSVFIQGASNNRRGSAGSIIDFAIEFNGFTGNDEKEIIKKAMRDIAVKFGVTSDEKHKNVPKVTYVPKRKAEGLILPQKSDNLKYVFAYLLNVRKIDISVVKYFVKNDMLYQDERNNCVFKTDKFGCIRSTFGKRFVLDVKGCNYDECFFFRGSDEAKTIVVAESVIDIMSIMTVFNREGRDIKQYCFLALAGADKIMSLFYHLEKEQKINHIMLGLDNDKGGANAQAFALDKLNKIGYTGTVEIYAAPLGKDWNEYIKLSSEEN